MARGDGVRRNIAHVSTIERGRFRDAIIELNNRHYPDGNSKWVKQNQIHHATLHVHGKPNFLPWHRELCNRFELLLRELDPELSLHYWDWTEDPRKASDGETGSVDLLTPEFMGTDNGNVEHPFVGFPQFDRKLGSSLPEKFPSDQEIINSLDQRSASEEEQWTVFREAVEKAHGTIHAYIGGSIKTPETAFRDPFVFLLHSNVDRLWAKWQTVTKNEWRLDPDKIYGQESHDSKIIEVLEPWAGSAGLRPWAPPDNQQAVKNSKDLTVVAPPSYDTNVRTGAPANHHGKRD